VVNEPRKRLRDREPRLCLTRVDHGYPLLPPGVTLEGPFPSECHCGMPWCTWTAQTQREKKRGYKRRRGTWVTRDGRFTLTWATSCGTATRSHPEGSLRMWDTERGVESWFVNIRDARAEMRKRYGVDDAREEERRERREYERLRRKYEGSTGTGSGRTR
jgi:hypothetical protein